MDASMSHELGQEAPGAGSEKLTMGLQEWRQVDGAWWLPADLAVDPGLSLAGLAKPREILSGGTMRG